MAYIQYKADTKAGAEMLAKKLRKEGYRARVVRNPRVGERSSSSLRWIVWNDGKK